MGYGHVAVALAAPGMARQVGWALAGLPSGSTVPWQRVLRSSGHIAGQGAPDRAISQRALLEREGIVFVNDKIDMRVYGLPPEHFLAQ